MDYAMIPGVGIVRTQTFRAMLPGTAILSYVRSTTGHASPLGGPFGRLLRGKL